MASALNWSDCLDYVALSDVGMRRASNQDAHAEVLAPDAEQWHARGHVFVVCDGMGAHAAGELASELAAEGIPHTYLKLRDQPPPEAIRRSIQEANAHIHCRGQSNAEFQGMGTTASALVLLPDGAVVAHVGDSRVYRLRGKRLDQLTFDHSLVWEMSAAGQVPKDAIPNFVPKNIITRSLGPHSEVQVDLEGPFPLEAGDVFLLCSDGLTGQVKDEEIGAILQSLSPQEAAAVLVDLANLRGGPDNITAIVIRIKVPGGSATAYAPNQPLAISADLPGTNRRRVNIPLLIAGGICLAAAVGLSALQMAIPAVVAGATGLALGLIGVLQAFGVGASEVRYLPSGMRLGRGPHSTVECEPNEKLVSGLASIVDQLRDAAAEEHWQVDWDHFNSRIQRAKSVAEHRQFKSAVQEYASALRFMMNELRNQRTRKQADTAQLNVMDGDPKR